MNKPAFFIFDARIHHPEAMQPYHQRVAATWKAFGGTLLVLGTAETIEGASPNGTLAMLQFASIDDARAWYDSVDYQEILPYRHAAAQTNGWLVEGIAQDIE